MPYFVYILKTSGNTYYTGQTNNLEQRMHQHTSKLSGSAKYLRMFESVELVYKEEVSSLGEALRREAEIKRMNRKQKERLITLS